MIKLNENYYITTDSNNWMLNYAEEKVKENGDKYVATGIWYYPKLSDLLSRALDEQLKNCETAEEIKQAIAQFEKTVENLDL